MTITTKQNKHKEPVKLRTKKLRNGNISLYLEYYRNGTRVYEYLKLYIVPECSDKDHYQNVSTFNAANAIKSQRVLELTNSKALIYTPAELDLKSARLVDWMVHYQQQQLTKGRKDSLQIKVAIDIIRNFAGENMCLYQVDKDFCKRLINYLLNDYRPAGKPISTFTAQNYYRVFNSALNAAVRADIIKVNPSNKLDNTEKIRSPESKREYMTIEEIRALIATPIHNNSQVKQAYLFSCFCGLRISDIMRIKWKDVYVDNGQYRLQLVMQKTREPIYQPLSAEAMKWMPEKGDKTPEDLIFDLPTPAYINVLLKPWAKAAGIYKRFTFHTARHTFATMMLTLGADLYTTSKLLGHSDVKITQIYAKIINRKKDEAVNLVNGLFD